MSWQTVKSLCVLQIVVLVVSLIAAMIGGRSPWWQGFCFITPICGLVAATARKLFILLIWSLTGCGIMAADILSVSDLSCSGQCDWLQVSVAISCISIFVNLSCICAGPILYFRLKGQVIADTSHSLALQPLDLAPSTSAMLLIPGGRLLYAQQLDTLKAPPQLTV
eukprot:TRINITY_DN13950_c0_g1_i1.p1 TRINITY_DN13950_c0_g1~~TRINITY_DN13950_c0_g1_i1.p1  ORF type:complete len:166 (-),score=17.03 TRINITY_DN13950_c0_g1_i1:820-1317(-)